MKLRADGWISTFLLSNSSVYGFLPFVVTGFKPHVNSCPICFELNMAQDSEKSQHDDVVEVTRLKEHDVVISKPMGMILTEISEDDPTAGVCILSIDPNGSTAKYNIACIAKGEVQRVICLEDRILAVQGERCETETFEQVIHRISQMNPSYDDKGIEVKLTLGRLEEGSVIQWPNGVCICCRSGDSLGLGKIMCPLYFALQQRFPIFILS